MHGTIKQGCMTTAKDTSCDRKSISSTHPQTDDVITLPLLIFSPLSPLSENMCLIKNKQIKNDERYIF